jgi:hypothetical protein
LNGIVTHGLIGKKSLINSPAEEFGNIYMTFVALNSRERFGYFVTRTFEHLNKEVFATDETARDSILFVVLARAKKNSRQGQVIVAKGLGRINELHVAQLDCYL